MKTTNFLKVIAAVALMTVISCGKEIETETLQPDTTPAEQPAEVKTYKMSIKAGKGKVATRALSLEGSTLNATWAEGEVVTVYNGETSLGTLTAQSAGASTTLEGELTGGTIAANDVLTLKFLSPSYGSQVGTLEYIAANCDYATATVTVKSVVDDNKITIKESAASFENQQAIVKFTLRQTDGTTAVSALPLKVVVGDNTYTVTPTAATDELFVAVPAIDGKKLILSATEGSTDYSYVKYSAAFENGKYYTITVKMSERTVVYNETELNDAIAAGKTNILMGCDIPLENYCGIGSDKTVTLDLGGSTLSRSIDTAYDYGSVIRVSTGGTLTITDSSEDGAATRADASTSSSGTGKITGGRATVGGGICNHGTLTLAGGTIVSNLASAAGGGIYNAPSTAGGTPVHFTMTGGVVLGNWGEDCGGVYNYTGSYITIEGGTIKGNTSNAGGGGVVNYGNATITGGTIETNTATTRGGGIWNGGTLSMSNVTITSNRAATDGGGVWNQGTISMQGKIVVNDNSFTVGGRSNLILSSGSVVNITGALDTDSVIGVYRENYQNGTITSGYNSTGGYSDLQYFQSDVDNFTLSYNEGEILFSAITAGDQIRYVNRTWNGTAVVSSEEVVTATNLASVLRNDHATYINGSGYYYVTGNLTTNYPLRIQQGDFHLILCDGAYLQIESLTSDQGAIHIYGQTQGTGTYKNELHQFGVPGIGTTSCNDVEVFIHGGVITAEALRGAAGIGGGYTSYNDDMYFVYYHTKSINIYGGTVTAYGGDEAAGIGTTSLIREFGTINIYGGTVTAYGGDDSSDKGGGAGIGGGVHGDIGTVNIYGGTVTAYGGDDSAGIGTGQDATSNYTYALDVNINISGGDVTATGGDYGAGIGGGDGVSGCNVTISGGTVRAYGGTDAAGIGSGEQAGSNIYSNLTITGGFVEATGGGYGSGLGAGEDTALGSITITGGTVIAHGGSENKAKAICSYNYDAGSLNSVNIANEMRFCIGDDIQSYTARQTLSSFKDIQIEPCPHDGSPCSWCLHGR